MSTPEETARTITLRSSDGETFEVSEETASMCQTIRPMIEDDCADGVIPLPNVTGRIMAKVIEFCKKHIEDKKKREEEKEKGGGIDSYSFMNFEAEVALRNWDTEFMQVDQETLFGLIMAANYLEVKDLLDLSCKTAADMMRGKSPDQIRELFHIKNDFTPEEEEEIRRENAWAFES